MILGQRNIQMHVAHGCNLTCQSCSHYTNTGGGKLVTKNEAIEWMSPWSKRISPDFFILIGGEPTLNKELVDITLIAAKMWPQSRIKIVSNGFFLGLHPELPFVMSKHNVCLEISVKSMEPAYQEKLQSIHRIVQAWSERHANLDIIWRNDCEHWIEIYHGYGPSMMPFNDGNSQKSFENCGFKICKVLHNGKLWKCPRLAFLKMQNDKFALHSSWNRYMNYIPLEPDCTNEEMISFFEEETISECDMCPVETRYIKIQSPLISSKELLNAAHKERLQLDVLDQKRQS